jgi:hypothetical protein
MRRVLALRLYFILLRLVLFRVATARLTDGMRRRAVEPMAGAFDIRTLAPRNPFSAGATGALLENKRSRAVLAAALQFIDFLEILGAGEGIRTLDPNLGKVVPLRHSISRSFRPQQAVEGGLPLLVPVSCAGLTFGRH